MRVFVYEFIENGTKQGQKAILGRLIE